MASASAVSSGNLSRAAFVHLSIADHALVAVRLVALAAIAGPDEAAAMSAMVRLIGEGFGEKQ